MLALFLQPKRLSALIGAVLLTQFSFANDLCEDAIELTCGDFVVVDLSEASVDISGEYCGEDTVQPGRWYRLAPGTGEYVVSNCDDPDDYWAELFAFYGTCDGLECVVANSGQCGDRPRITWPAHETLWSYVYVSGFSAPESANIELEVSCTNCAIDGPANDTCAEAEEILGGSVQASLCCAGVDEPGQCTPAFTEPYGVFYKFNSQNYLDITFSLDNNTGSNVAMALFVDDQGMGCGFLDEVACGGPVTGTVAGELAAFLTLQANTDYYWYVYSTDPDGCGLYTLTIDGVGEGDYGCNDPDACNYDPEILLNDGTCEYPEPGLDCDNECLEDADEDGVCDDDEVAGCTDPFACNFDPAATDPDNEQCYYANPLVDCDGNCILDENDNGICDLLEIQAGCIGEDCCGEGTIYDPILQTCVYPEECVSDINGDGIVGTQDILGVLGAFGFICQ